MFSWYSFGIIFSILTVIYIKNAITVGVLLTFFIFMWPLFNQEISSSSYIVKITANT